MTKGSPGRLVALVPACVRSGLARLGPVLRALHGMAAVTGWTFAALLIVASQVRDWPPESLSMAMPQLIWFCVQLLMIINIAALGIWVVCKAPRRRGMDG